MQPWWVSVSSVVFKVFVWKGLNWVSPPALELLKTAISKAGYTDKVVIGMDVAASEFYKGGKYDLDFKSPDDPSRYISHDKLADLYKSFVKDYPGQFLLILLKCKNI